MSGNSKILIAEGDAENLQFLQMQLSYYGYNTIMVSNGDEALDAAAHNTIDLIIIDVALPGKDACEITRTLKADDHTRTIPVILAVSFMAEAEKAKGIEAGCDDFINKPLDSFEILTRVRSLLKVKAYHDHMLDNTITHHKTITARIETEQRLRENENVYSFIVQNATDGVVIIQDKSIIFANTRMAEMSGYSIEELIGMSTFNLVPLDFVPVLEERFRFRAEAKEVPDVYETRLLCKDGNVRQMEASTKLIEYNGRPAVISIIRDVTERKHLEEMMHKYRSSLEDALVDRSTELMGCEEKYHFIFDSITDGISVIDLATGKIVDANDSALRMFNFEREDIIGMPAFELVAEKDRQRSIEDSINTIATGDSGLAEWCLLGKDGTEHDCEARAGVFYDRSGKPLYMVNVMRDIGERKRITESIKESERRYRMLAENVSDAIITLDMNLRFTYISPSAFRISTIRELGLPNDGELTGKAVQEVLTPESFIELCKVLGEELVLEVYGEAQPFRSRVLEIQLMTKDKSALWAEVRGSFLRDDKGHVTGILGIMRDITQKKRDAEARAAIERKAQTNSRFSSIGIMAAGIAHEINNPLTPIVGLADTLLKQDLTESVKSDIRIIHDCANQAAGVINRLLAFARQGEPLHTRCNINDIVENTLQIMDHGLKKNKITYVTEIDYGLPDTIADKAQIQQVLLNMIVNAEEAMTGFGGCGNLLIQTKYVDNLIRIFIKDDGPGISNEMMERVFDPFFTTKDAGTGLGLSICHGIIAEHNGRIYVESEDGKGATFIVELPVIKQESEEKVKPLILPNPMIQRKE